jgi:hypothetical protein
LRGICCGVGGYDGHPDAFVLMEDNASDVYQSWNVRGNLNGMNDFVGWALL